MGSTIKRMLRKSVWAPLAAEAVFVWLSYGWLWDAIEPVLGLTPAAQEKLPANALLIHVLFAAALGLQLTIIFVVIVRATDRGTAYITQSEMLEVNHQLQPVLASIGALAHQGVPPAQIRRIVYETACAVARIHFGKEELPIMPEEREYRVPVGIHFNCGLCRQQRVEVTRTGQCQRCKLYGPGWTGVYQPQDIDPGEHRAG